MKSKKEEKLLIEPIETNFETGLTDAQVAQRVEAGLINKKKRSSGKSVWKIVFENVFTFFNMVWGILFALLVFVGSYKDLLFMVIIVANTLIAIIQEVKAKIAVDKLAFEKLIKVKAIRNGKEVWVVSEKLVLDDVFYLCDGQQVPADCVVIQGEVYANESLLTGESVPIKKGVGAKMLSGSFLTSGGAYVRATHVGNKTYIASIEKQAKKFKSPTSDLFKDLNRIIKVIGIFVLPIGVVMFINNYYALDKNFAEAISKTCGSVGGLIPAGMFLLVTIALSAGVVRLAKRKTLVQDIYSIEMLARTNVLCLDKTGTITDGTMKVSEVIAFKDAPFKTDYVEVLQNLLAIQPTNNNTSIALIEYFEKKRTLNCLANLPFSSDKKFMAASFDEVGTVAIGAIEFLNCTKTAALKSKAKQLATQGYRVIVVAGSKDLCDGDILPDNMAAFALIAIEDHIRPDAKDIIAWFTQNDVEVKIISGDNPLTVSNIARRVGVQGWQKSISLENMSIEEVERIADDFTIFGRVTPEQKYVIVKALKKQGKIVAMTGDGVNDTLALKESDCSIAMAEGSEAARSIANIVLMDNKFSSLPQIVAEGRQVINNVQSSSTLFLMKTLFAFAVSIFAILTTSPYPFSTSQMVLIEFAVIGVPSLILAFEANTKLIKGSFISTVFRQSIPYAVILIVSVAAVLLLGKNNILSTEEVVTLSTLVLTSVGFVNLLKLCTPLTAYRAAAISISALLIVSAFLFVPEFFNITVFSTPVMWGYLCIVTFAVLLHFGYSISERQSENRKITA